jgi:uncharacterized membrane protein YoaK (UPF0700 family)
VLGKSSTLAKVLALPVFCIVVIAVRLVWLRARSRPVMRSLLAAQLTLTILGAVLATWFGPFALDRSRELEALKWIEAVAEFDDR